MTMNRKIRVWLLFLLFEVATPIGNAETTTARYNIPVGNMLAKQTAIFNVEPRQFKPTNFTDYGRKLKRRQQVKLPPKLKFGRGNHTNPTNKLVVSNATHNNTLKSNQTLAGKRIATLKPKLKIKLATNDRAVSTTPKSNTRPTSSANKTVIRHNFGHYKNYTKFRIKPVALEKQTNPNPGGLMPQITVYSPQYSIADGLSAAEDSTGSGSSSPELSSSPFGVPISQVFLQSIPSDLPQTYSSDNGCPTFQLSSYVYGPATQRQGCPDLNVVINSQLSQNSVTQRVPEAVVADEVVGNPAPAADPLANNDEVAAASAPPAETNSGATNSGGGLPQLPGLPELPELPSLPDLKGLFDVLGLVWRLLSGVLRFFANPYLYLVPAALSFGVGFVKVLSLVPWWLIPAYFLVASKKKGPEVVHYKHVHQPIHHHDEWFWNHNTKTWTSVFDYVHRRQPVL